MGDARPHDGCSQDVRKDKDRAAGPASGHIDRAGSGAGFVVVA